MHTHYFGASVKGPFHHAERRPNEDAWLGVRGDFGTLVVVSDGLGSRPQARRGSRMACLAVRDAVRHWAAAENAPMGHLVRLVELLWRLRITPASPEDCAATCLFALVRPPGQLVVAGLGDGMVAVRVEGEPARWVLGRRGDAFSNETAALGAARGPGAWSVQSFDTRERPVAAVLATDGISDDLLENRVDGFVSWLLETFAPLEPGARWRELSRELRDWPTPQHLDDKTLAVVWSQPRDERDTP
ncbi:PP2C family serine/threonine-protein phosphatase [Archangium violaceum]|uniref:PPM-type phosphatase domain-containing protein n=1 Tax=Archangium violaceum Cb vi76 TaxID=1406225 RepID=A0A084SPE0_9BACT|nr:PP2C family serine/threonine-protein phosphatase [Archangium violaceum]KFA90325.1 hypothetical protein Q664_29380 [Archangium violaceum Cb vi76]